MKLRIGLLLLIILPAIWGFLIEPSLLTQRDISLEHWEGPPLKIAFLADLHAGSPHIDDDYIVDLVKRINAMSPDLVLIGGDLVINGVLGGHPIPFTKVVQRLKELNKAPLGTFAVLGNHDWWNDARGIRKSLEENGIPVIDNEARLIRVDSKFNFWLVGIGDDYTEHARPELALAQIKSNEPRILFMHDPAAIFRVKEKFFMTLAGHMHGGQIFIPGIGAIITPGDAPKYWASGWVDFKLGSLFVSKGVGTSIIPVRFNALPEFVILSLKNK
jgi:uncharacterized protein